MNHTPDGVDAATDGEGGRPADRDDGESLARRYRPEFPIFENKRYLNSNSLGALSVRSMRERREFESDWHELGAASWYERWMAKLDEVRHGFAATAGVAGEDVALMPSVSACLTAVAGALDFDERPKVVLTELDFPTVAHQFLSRRRTGVEVEIVESPDGLQVPLEAIEDAVDDRTALLATSHVFFTTGAVQDPAALARIAHRRGAFLLLDAYQSNGQLPVRAEEWEVDFLASGALKWMLGGPGLAYLYVRRELADRLQPTTLSWFGVRDQFAFDLRDAEPRPGARRFEMGTPATGAAFTAAGGLEVIREVGISRIRRRNARLAEDLIERLRNAGFGLRVPSEPESRSALVLARHPHAERAVESLRERGIVVDSRAGCVRFSPHFYNTVEDNEAAVAALAETEGAPGKGGQG